MEFRTETFYQKIVESRNELRKLYLVLLQVTWAIVGLYILSSISQKQGRKDGESTLGCSLIRKLLECRPKTI